MNHTTNDIFKNGTNLKILLSDETVISSHQYPLAIIHTDISQFMLFNDGQGHDKGDEVLVTLGETIYRSIIDFKFHIYRYSDEFIIIVYICDTPPC